MIKTKRQAEVWVEQHIDTLKIYPQMIGDMICDIQETVESELIRDHKNKRDAMDFLHEFSLTLREGQLWS